jgi:hypothetical protein
MNTTEILDVKNLSSRKLLGLVISGELPDLQLQLAEQELSLRRHHLERWGDLYGATKVIQQQPNRP